MPPDSPRHSSRCTVRGASLRSFMRRPVVRGIFRRVRYAVLFDLTMGAYLTGVAFTLLQLSQGKSFVGKDLFAAHWSVLFVVLYYVFLFYAPVLLLAAFAAQGRSFRAALLIRLAAFAAPAGALTAEAVLDFGPAGAFDLLWDRVGVPLVAGLLSTAAAEIVLHALPPRWKDQGRDVEARAVP